MNRFIMSFYEILEKNRIRKLYLVRRVQFQWYKYLRPFNEQPKNLEEETRYDMIKLFRSKIEGQNSPPPPPPTVCSNGFYADI